MSYKCSICSFFCNRKYNLERHEKTQHFCDKKAHVCDHCGKEYKTKGHFQNHVKTCNPAAGNVAQTAQNVSKVTQNVSKTAQNVSQVTQNVSQVTQNVSPKKCSKCGKVFTRNLNLKLHIPKCNGKLNSLECHRCSTVFKTRLEKSRHLQECTGIVVPITEHQIVPAQQITNNTTNNNIQNNSNNTTNIQKVENHVTNVIVFDPEGSILNDRLDRKTMKRIFPRNSENLQPQLCRYAEELLRMRENQYVRKPHMTNAYSHVHTEQGWRMLPDNYIFPSISRDIANSANDRLYEHPTIGNPIVREKLTDIVSNIEENCKDLKDLSMYLKTLANQIDKELKLQEGLQDIACEKMT